MGMGGLRGSMESEGEEADSKKVLAKRERGHRRRRKGQPMESFFRGWGEGRGTSEKQEEDGRDREDMWD